MMKMLLKSKLLHSFSVGGGSAAGLSWKNHIFFLLSVLVYILIFIIMSKGENFGMGAAVIIPVIAAAWIYGTAVGCAAGLLALAAHIGMCQIMGLDWYLRIIKTGAGARGAIGLMLIGCVIGCISDLRRRLKKELAAKELVERELQQNREHLEKLVANRTEELSAAFQLLMASNRELVERQQALARNEERLRSIFETAVDAILTTNSTGVIIHWNNGAERIFGYAASEVIGRNVSMILPESIRQRDKQAMQKALQNNEFGVYRHIEGAALRKDGTKFPTEVSQSLWKSGDEVFSTGIVRDITERKKVEEDLREREERLCAILETALDAIITTDSQGEIVSWNRAAERIFGYTEAEIIGKNAHIMMPERLRGDMSSLKNMFWLQGVQASSEMIGLKKDGTEFPLEATCALWNGGDQILATAIVRDITERKNAERDRMLLSTAIEQSHENIIIMDAQGVILYANPAVERLMCLPMCQILGGNAFQPRDVLYEQPFLNAIYAQLQSGKIWKGVLNYKAKDGATACLEQKLSPVFGPDGKLSNILSVSRDVTHEQNLEEQLRQSQKMEAIGTLAGGIAHDFNNILAAIMGYTELAALDLPADSATAGRLRHVIDSCDRARSLVRQILTFSRKNPQKQCPVNINNSIREVVSLLRASLPSTIEIRPDIADPDAVVMADPTQLHQLIINLCTNASQAMEETGGILSISLDSRIVNLNELRCCYDLKAGPYVQLVVRDTGPGIPSEIKEKIFDPFFTTKPVGKGTGMGLSVAHGIVKSYGGCIYAENDPAGGATLYVLLPRIHQIPTELDHEHAVDIPGGAETILLVDDEEAVMKTCEGMLTVLGYTVVCTDSSMEALELFSAQPGRFDCVITDMTMPYLRGDVLARKLLELRPGLPVILCTGFSEKISEAQAMEQGIKAFLLKPHTMQDLAAAVRKVIDAAAQH